MSERKRKSGRSARPDVAACRKIVLPPANEQTDSLHGVLRSREEHESAGLRGWIRRYVALVAEADVEARGNSGKEPEGP
ncbi:MAG TPA: hypothetical protein VGX50_19485 [Longimicrobium sp.]|jgi:hypothetical protein|nr:hypothetical protein [Longimicrobium sp.]